LRHYHQLSGLSFSLYYYGHHRDLHSFPTRRSSDLVRYREMRGELELAALSHLAFHPDRSAHHGNQPSRNRQSEPGSSVLSGRRRSEEHTSELQSQSNLVCRLLLEKKKKTRISIRHD